MLQEDPVNFNIRKEYKNHKIVYSNLKEIVQGGPEVGNLFINEIPLPLKHFFGGPNLVYNKYLLVPMFVRKFCKSGFTLCRIDLQTLKIEYLGVLRNLILLKEIDTKNNLVRFYTDLEKKKLEEQLLPAL